MLRPYQQEAVDAATDWMRRSVMPGLLELATGAGKSHIAAAIAHWVYEQSGKKVLVLQPSKELTEQNHQKYLLTGNRASIFSASAGSKCMTHNVVYGTPGTVKNALSRFGERFGAVIVDEAHETTPTIKLIIQRMREKNKNLRVIGMTATPYRMLTGYIYQYDVDGRFMEDHQAADPYYNTLLYRIETRELIEAGYLTNAHADPDLIEQYKTGSLQVNRRGQFDSADVERVFEGRGRLTYNIISDVVAHSHGRMGVMIFAATVNHAKECMESLPPGNSRMLGGDVNMSKNERARLIDDFKAMRFKYLVSVGTLTRGFDAEHVDTIAVLRATESPALFQQIIGRGLRLHPDKSECLVLDYAENIDRHGLHNDLFTPTIKTVKSKSDVELIDVICPACAYPNQFAARENKDGYLVDDQGYFTDLAGNYIDTGDGPIPAHYGRRCRGQLPSPIERGVYEQCEQRWSTKECPECAHANDIAARYCESCKAEIVNPNEKLQIEFAKIKADPYQISTDPVIKWKATQSTSAAGNDMIVCEYTTDCRTFKVYYMPESKAAAAVPAWRSLCGAVFNGHIAPDCATFMQHLDKGKPPETVTSYRERGSKFFRVIAHNWPADAL